MLTLAMFLNTIMRYTADSEKESGNRLIRILDQSWNSSDDLSYFSRLKTGEKSALSLIESADRICKDNKGEIQKTFLAELDRFLDDSLVPNGRMSIARTLVELVLSDASIPDDEVIPLCQLTKKALSSKASLPSDASFIGGLFLFSVFHDSNRTRISGKRAIDAVVDEAEKRLGFNCVPIVAANVIKPVPDKEISVLIQGAPFLSISVSQEKDSTVFALKENGIVVPDEWKACEAYPAFFVTHQETIESLTHTVSDWSRYKSHGVESNRERAGLLDIEKGTAGQVILTTFPTDYVSSRIMGEVLDEIGEDIVPARPRTAPWYHSSVGVNLLAVSLDGFLILAKRSGMNESFPTAGKIYPTATRILPWKPGSENLLSSSVESALKEELGLDRENITDVRYKAVFREKRFHQDGILCFIQLSITSDEVITRSAAIAPDYFSEIDELIIVPNDKPSLLAFYTDNVEQMLPQTRFCFSQYYYSGKNNIL